LLRSMITNPAYRNKGIAGKLVRQLFQYAQSLKLTEIYLLTETAEKYFANKGFTSVLRDNVPEAIKQSQEFSHTCPSTAIVMKKEIMPKRKLLFVCVENSNRSQMSQAFAKIIGGDNVEAYSAGSKPSGIVNPKAIVAMKELGYDLSLHDSKSLQEVEQYAPFDTVVTMGCGDACPWMPAKKFIDWEIPDPKHMEPADFNKVRDYIKSKVGELIESLK
jgi:arsenate reductase (thioredoxin)